MSAPASPARPAGREPPAWVEPDLDDWQNPQPGEDEPDVEGALWAAKWSNTL